jgi:putative adenylate-forming enzyme
LNSFNVLKHYLRFRFSSFSSREAVEAWQAEQIRKHLYWVSLNSPFYARCRAKPLEQWPLMNKAVMMEHFDSLNTVNIKKDEAFLFAEKAEHARAFDSTFGSITVGLSSGTSGNRGIFLASEAERELWAGAILGKMVPDLLWRRHRVALFLRAGSTLYNSVNSKHLQFQFFDMAQPMERNLIALNAYKPDIIFAPGQILKLLAKEAEHLVFAPKRLIACAEVLYDDAREAAKRAWGIDPEQIYQCTEGFLACSQRGSFQLNEDLVHIEPNWLDESKTRFKPIITDFRRTSQPIIRYELDDVLSFNPESQTVFRELARIEGRCDDIIEAKTLTGEIVPLYPDFLVRAVIFQSDIDRFQLVQREIGRLFVKVALKDFPVITDILIRFYESKGWVVPVLVFEELVADPLAKQRRVVKANGANWYLQHEGVGHG